MTRIFKTVERTVSAQEEAKRICDWCGHEEGPRSLHSDRSRFTARRGDAYDFKFSLRTGSVDIDGGGAGYSIEPDLCRACVIKLVEELRKLGIKMEEKEWNC